MRHRIFIAINLPEETKRKLVSYQEKIEELFISSQYDGRGPVKWTKKDNLHITLEFLGYVADDELLEICRNTRKLASKHKPFTITLNKICYGPLQKMPPRLIWITGEKIGKLNFSPHITLGRIKTWQWKQIDPEERPDVEKDINLNFEVNSIEIMESVLKKEGPEYTALESVPLKF